MAQADDDGKKSGLMDLLHSPEMETVREMFRENELRQAAEDQAWWDSLTMDERAQAFRQVVKLMYHAEVAKRGSYRYAMYDIFDIDYADGLAHYMALHNLIYKGLEVS
jgi:hypothetical protein